MEREGIKGEELKKEKEGQEEAGKGREEHHARSQALGAPVKLSRADPWPW